MLLFQTYVCKNYHCSYVQKQKISNIIWAKFEESQCGITLKYHNLTNSLKNLDQRYIEISSQMNIFVALIFQKVCPVILFFISFKFNTLNNISSIFYTFFSMEWSIFRFLYVVEIFWNIQLLIIIIFQWFHYSYSQNYFTIFHWKDLVMVWVLM